MGEPKIEFQPKKVEPSNEEGEVRMTQEEYEIKNQRYFIAKSILNGYTEEIECLSPLHKENAVVDGYRVIQTGRLDGREIRVEKIEA